MENGKTRYLYILIGLALLALAITFFSWFYPDFVYLFSKPTIPWLWARLGAFLSALLLGIFYLFYGVKSNRINKRSNRSIAVLLTSIVLSFILQIIEMSGVSYGGPSKWYAPYARTLMILSLIIGIFITIILCALSMRDNYKS